MASCLSKREENFEQNQQKLEPQVEAQVVSATVLLLTVFTATNQTKSCRTKHSVTLAERPECLTASLFQHN